MATRTTPRMTATVTETPVGFNVLVEHADHQSYSRAVYPYGMKRANQHARAHPGLGPVTLADVAYSVEMSEPDLTPAHQTRSVSRFRFIAQNKVRSATHG